MNTGRQASQRATRRVDRLGCWRRPLADEVTQHPAHRRRARAELALRLDLLQQAGQLGVED